MTTLAAASSNSVQPGTLGFLVVFGLAVILTLLFRSMSKHLRKVNAAARQEEEEAAAASSAAAKDGTAGDTVATDAGRRAAQDAKPSGSRDLLGG